MTSSLTPGMTEYSWGTPSIFTQVTAVPWMELSSSRRSGLPTVVAYPRSSGSRATQA